MTMNAQKTTASAAATMVQASPALADYEVSEDMAEMLATMEAKGGDPGGMTDAERADYVRDICRMLRLNPLTRPAQFVKLSGKWVLYLTRTATDQLAARYNLNRETIVPPCIVDIAGVKVGMCVVKVTLPNGRSETATATLPITDPAGLYMRLETKAKRRATLSILGLGVLSEDEAEDASDAAQGPRRGNERPLFTAPAHAPQTPAGGSPVAVVEAPSPRAEVVNVARATVEENPDAEPADNADATPVELALAAIDACKSIRFLNAAAKVLYAKHYPGDAEKPAGTHPLSADAWGVIAAATHARRDALKAALTTDPTLEA